MSLPNVIDKIEWSRDVGYECSSAGDKRFSAFFALLEDGRSIEQHYQCDIKGYEPGGRNWRLGKGKPALNANTDLWNAYLNLWKLWAKQNSDLIELLREKVKICKCLRDRFATSQINQARALAEILNMKNVNISDANKTEAYTQYMAQLQLVKTDSWRCCANCLSVQRDSICGENGLQIPVSVAVVGCGKWDNLPF